MPRLTAYLAPTSRPPPGPRRPRRPHRPSSAPPPARRLPGARRSGCASQRAPRASCAAARSSRAAPRPPVACADAFLKNLPLFFCACAFALSALASMLHSFFSKCPTIAVSLNSLWSLSAASSSRHAVISLLQPRIFFVSARTIKGHHHLLVGAVNELHLGDHVLHKVGLREVLVEECKNKNNACAACLLEREFIRNETPHWP